MGDSKNNKQSIWKESNETTSKCDEQCELLEMKEEFEKAYTNATKYLQSFTDIIENILKDETYESFDEKTGLGADMFYRLKKRVNKNDPTRKSTIVTLCKRTKKF